MEEGQVCKVSRWQLLKSQLNNLEAASFLEAIQQDEDFKLLDVRTDQEFQSGHLAGAVHMDYFGEDFWDRFDQLNPKKTYYVYCRSGRRSARVCLWMKNAGFVKVFNLEDGLKSVPDNTNLLS